MLVARDLPGGAARYKVLDEERHVLVTGSGAVSAAGGRMEIEDEDGTRRYVLEIGEW